MGFQRWNTDGDVEDQYETFNGMPVYYGGDLYDSEDSDWDDPYALASAAYVEDYNFHVPEGMDLMVHRHSRIPDSLDVRQDCQMDVAPVYQTVSNATEDQWDTSDNDSLTATADENDPYMIRMVQCRKVNIVLFQTKGSWRTSTWTGWTMWIMMIRMSAPLRNLVIAAQMLIWRMIVFLI